MTVTRLSFFLSVPVLGAAGVLQVLTEYDRISNGVGWPATLVATAISFVVAYAAVGGLLRFVARHDYTVFIGYRLLLGTGVLVLVGAGALSAT